jgi:hypothetical protein
MRSRKGLSARAWFYSAPGGFHNHSITEASMNDAHDNARDDKAVLAKLTGTATLTGRFGDLTREQATYLLTIARAYAFAPEDGWAEARLETILDEECNRFGVGQEDVLTHPAIQGAAPIDDTMKGNKLCPTCEEEIEADVAECYSCQERRERREARNDAGVD